tara:strand:+ start:918 stop:1145 length:228 start_codon:yes stop_codon:yes gene_type:complete
MCEDCEVGPLSICFCCTETIEEWLPWNNDKKKKKEQQPPPPRPTPPLSMLRGTDTAKPAIVPNVSPRVVVPYEKV